MKFKDDRSLIKHIISGVSWAIIISLILYFIYASVMICTLFNHTLLGKIYIINLKMLILIYFIYVIYTLIQWSKK